MSKMSGYPGTTRARAGVDACCIIGRVLLQPSQIDDEVDSCMDYGSTDSQPHSLASCWGFAAEYSATAWWQLGPSGLGRWVVVKKRSESLRRTANLTLCSWRTLEAVHLQAFFGRVRCPYLAALCV